MLHPGCDSAGMAIQSYRLYIERTDTMRNMARFYALSIEPTLFGDIALVRKWGRIGTRGQMKLQLLETEMQALELFLGIARSKRARGYRPRSQGSISVRSP
jgi:predicted DNA-binding WGR domain protein